MSGKIYFVSAPGRIKVGYTLQPERRLMSLQYSDMETLTSLGVIDGDRAGEKHLHLMLKPYNIRGEWFQDCEAVRSVVAKAISGEIVLPRSKDYSIEKDIRFEHVHHFLDPRLASVCSERAADLTAALEDDDADKFEIQSNVRELLDLSRILLAGTSFEPSDAALIDAARALRRVDRA